MYNGNYTENVNVIKQLTLRGIGMPVVNASDSGSAINLSADGITLVGFTATGGGIYPEAGIRVNSNSNNLSGNNASIVLNVTTNQTANVTYSINGAESQTLRQRTQPQQSYGV